MNSQRDFFWRCLAVLCALFVCGICAAGERGLPAREGILYRGAQPDAAGIENLKKLGIKSIINLRQTNDVLAAEVEAARTQGILYTNVPLHGLGRPTKGEIQHILTLMTALPSPVFVHCEHGCDRTGTVVACYRIQHDKWEVVPALAEAEAFGMSRLERGMKDFVRDFGRTTK